MLTDGRRVSVINAPAGSGKTRVLAEAARIWAAAGLGPVIGITPSQSARNTLAAGVPVSYNSAQFLGHLPGRRGARGPVPIGPGTLLVIDEASMMSSPDLADLIAYAESQRRARSSWPGTPASCRRWRTAAACPCSPSALGYVRLAEPVRFRHAWEQAASLRLRDGDTTVLAEYDQHARITGGDPEQMMDAAAAAYVALTAGGTDTLLMAADHALRRELSRRIRDDLIRLGLVQAGPAVTIADGTQASAGDLIVCTRNDHRIEAGEPGRTLANGDLLRIEAITRRRPARPPRPGRRPGNRAAPLDRPTVPVHELRRCRTRLRGHRPRRPGPHRAHRPGRDHRHRGPPARLRRPDPRHRRQHRLRLHRVAQDRRPGPRPAPGPRARPLRPPHRRPGGGPAAPAADPGGPAGRARRRAGPRRPAAVRDPDPRQALADADHLAVLHAIWTAETTPARDQRYRDLLDDRPAARLPARSPATRRSGCGGRCAPPNWPAWTPPRSWPRRSPSGT